MSKMDIAPEGVKQSKKILFKPTTIKEMVPALSLNATMLKQRVGEILRVGVETEHHLCLRTGFTLKKVHLLLYS